MRMEEHTDSWVILSTCFRRSRKVSLFVHTLSIWAQKGMSLANWRYQHVPHPRQKQKTVNLDILLGKLSHVNDLWLTITQVIKMWIYYRNYSINKIATYTPHALSK